VHITAQGCRLRNDLYCVEWDVKLYYTTTTLVNQYQNVSVLGIIGAKDDGGVVTTGAIRRAKLQSNRHHQQTNTQLSIGQMPNQQCQSTEGKTSFYKIFSE